MCVQCDRCRRPYYCQARITHILSQGFHIPAQQVLDVGPISRGVKANECIYNFLLVETCVGCKPFDHASSHFIETPLNRTGDDEWKSFARAVMSSWRGIGPLVTSAQSVKSMSQSLMSAFIVRESDEDQPHILYSCQVGPSLEGSSQPIRSGVKGCLQISWWERGILIVRHTITLASLSDHKPWRCARAYQNHNPTSFRE